MAEQTRREFLSVAGLAAASVPSLALPESAGRRRRNPNVILIMSDDQGYGDLSGEGNQQLKTPYLDHMKREGASFTNFYVCPVCAPTRACLMTGRYNYRSGVADTFVGLAMMRPGEVTIADVLSQSGFRTGIFGKWHLGENYPMRAMDRGFQESLVFNGGTIGNIADPLDNTYTNPVLFHNGQAQKYQGYCTDIFFNAALDFIARAPDSPFFVYIPTNVVHGPVRDVPESYLKPFQAMGLDNYSACIYAMMANLDDNVGHLFSKLKEWNLDQDTVVIFLSDNGPAGPARFNLGLRASKSSIYEGGIKVPFYARCPGRIPEGKQIDRIAAHIDVFATVLEICGVPKPLGLKLDGASLWPLMTRKDVSWPDRTLFFQQDRPDPEGWDVPRPYVHCAARGQRYKIVMAGSKGKIYTRSIGFGETELYDITADPAEKNNLASQHPELVFAMRNQYIDWFLDASRGLYPAVSNLLGEDASNPVTLTSRDLSGPHAHQAPTSWAEAHKMAQSEPDGCGYFEVEVRRAGRYRITCRFGPPEAEGIPQIKQGMAFLRLGKVATHQPVPMAAQSAVFDVNVEAGNQRLETFFTGQRGDGGAVSPFFVDVEFLGF